MLLRTLLSLSVAVTVCYLPVRRMPRAVLDRCLTPVVRRTCARDPADRDCMTHAELDEIAELVPVHPE